MMLHKGLTIPEFPHRGRKKKEQQKQPIQNKRKRREEENFPRLPIAWEVGDLGKISSVYIHTEWKVQGTQEIPFGHQAGFLCCVDDGAQPTQRLWKILLCRSYLGLGLVPYSGCPC